MCLQTSFHSSLYPVKPLKSKISKYFSQVLLKFLAWKQNIAFINSYCLPAFKDFLILKDLRWIWAQPSLTLFCWFSQSLCVLLCCLLLFFQRFSHNCWLLIVSCKSSVQPAVFLYFESHHYPRTMWIINEAVFRKMYRGKNYARRNDPPTGELDEDDFQTIKSSSRALCRPPFMLEMKLGKLTESASPISRSRVYRSC